MDVVNPKQRVFEKEVFYAKLYQIKIAKMGDDERDYLAAWIGLMVAYGVCFKTEDEFVENCGIMSGTYEWSVWVQLECSVVDWFCYFVCQTISFREHTFIRYCEMCFNLKKAHNI